MKNGKNPTKREKIIIESQGLNPENWLIYKKVANELHLVHRDTKDKRIIGN
ncbi:hypothetical protein PDQ34_26005 [Bacillus cereus]|nr:hypothetical protein [Bacillus cereus]MDA2572668.1 hypothetical protein [Bacillus cereus]